MQKRYVTMDGLRGIAAIYVVMFHAKDWFGVLRPTKGYVAVDLFFDLSGFVVAASYEHKLRAGLTFWRFFRIRMIRLYPLYLVGLTLAVVVLTTASSAGGQFIGGRIVEWTALPTAVVALPGPFLLRSTDYVYPLNFPAWSLFFEFAINLIYALTFRYCSLRVLPVVIAISGGLPFMFGGDGDKGWSWAGFPIGMLRCAYAFPFGVLICKADAAGYRAPGVPGLLCLAAFSALLLTPTAYVIPVCALAGAPLIVMFAASARTGETFARVFSQLGLASYALYAVHIALMNATLAVLYLLNAHPNTYVVGFAFLAAILPLCILLDRYCDAAVRRRLTLSLPGAGRATNPLRVGQPTPSHATI